MTLTDDQIFEREKESFLRLPDGSKRIDRALQKGKYQGFAVRDFLILRGRVKDEEEEINVQGDLYGSNLYRYQQLQAKKRALAEAEEELFSEPATFTKIAGEVGTRLTNDPFAKEGQIAADVIRNERDKDEVERLEFERVFNKNPLPQMQRNFYNTFDPTRPPYWYKEKWR